MLMGADKTKICKMGRQARNLGKVEVVVLSPKSIG